MASVASSEAPGSRSRARRWLAGFGERETWYAYAFILPWFLGFVLLTATLLAGFLFSEVLYGTSVRAWKWDHKTVFSVLAWVTFGVLLVGRARFGWRGRAATRVLYTGSVLLLLAYVGSRFVLEVVLHRAA